MSGTRLNFKDYNNYIDIFGLYSTLSAAFRQKRTKGDLVFVFLSYLDLLIAIFRVLGSLKITQVNILSTHAPGKSTVYPMVLRVADHGESN